MKFLLNQSISTIKIRQLVSLAIISTPTYMGNSSSEFENASPVVLDQHNALNVFGQQNCHGHSLDLAMKEKVLSLSGDDFTITDKESGQPMYKIHGKAFSMRDKKKLLDVHGNMIGTIKEKHLTMHRRMYILDSDKMVRVVVRKSSYFQLAASADAWILKKPLKMDDINKAETKSRPADICMGGNWRSKNFIFVMNPSSPAVQIAGGQQQVIAKTQRKGMNARGLLAGKDTYYIHIPAYVDAALILLLSVTLDEIFRDDNK